MPGTIATLLEHECRTAKYFFVRHEKTEGYADITSIFDTRDPHATGQVETVTHGKR